jgi:hypothetical protein
MDQGFRVQGSRFKVGFRVQGSGFKVGFRVQGSGFTDWERGSEDNPHRND